MNYLAHSYLSFSEEQLVGNMIADFIKNDERSRFSTEIQKGIKLHREIDTFTDSHPIIHEAKKVYQPLVRLYSGAFVDVSMDYFLANKLDENQLKNHAEKVYVTLKKYQEILPDNFTSILQRMEQDNWLFNYRYDWGIEYSMKNVINKAQYLSKELSVFSIFSENKTSLSQYFNQFFPLLEKHCESFKKTGL